MTKTLYIVFEVMLLFCVVVGDLQNDENECAKTVQGLGPCIPFLEGVGADPPNACCGNVKEIRENNPKCLCTVLKDTANPSVGLSLNQTRLIQMPNICKVQGKLSDCIAILNLSPSSPDARIFEVGTNLSSPTGSTSQSTPAKDDADLGLKPCFVFSGVMALAAFFFTLFHS